MYVQLTDLVNNMNNLSTSMLFITGDFNAKVGTSTGIEQCLGRYSRGRRNNSGETLVQFCDANGLFICNSAFRHPARHITTWSQHKKDSKSDKMISVFNQIDYIVCNRNQAHTMTDARSFAGTETSSDHRLVVTRIRINWPNIYRKFNKQTGVKRYNTDKLIENPERYRQMLDQKMQTSEDSSWDSIKKAITETAPRIQREEETSSCEK